MKDLRGNGVAPQPAGPPPLRFQSARPVLVRPQCRRRDTDCILDLCVAKQDLDRSKVAGGLIDHGSLRSPQGMRSVILPTKPKCGHPFIDKSSVLPSAEMIGVVDATGKGIVIDCSSPSLKPGEQTSSDLGRKLELHGSSSLLLDDHRASSNILARDECPNFSVLPNRSRGACCRWQGRKALDLASFLHGRGRSGLPRSGAVSKAS